MNAHTAPATFAAAASRPRLRNRSAEAAHALIEAHRKACEAWVEAEEMAEAEHGALRQRYWRAGGHRLNVERKAMQALNDYCPQTIEEAAEIARYLLALKTRHHADHQDFESLVRRLAGM